jgi:hypothetical protein
MAITPHESSLLMAERAVLSARLDEVNAILFEHVSVPVIEALSNTQRVAKWAEIPRSNTDDLRKWSTHNWLTTSNSPHAGALLPFFGNGALHEKRRVNNSPEQYKSIESAIKWAKKQAFTRRDLGLSQAQ